MVWTFIIFSEFANIFIIIVFVRFLWVCKAIQFCYIQLKRIFLLLALFFLPDLMDTAWGEVYEVLFLFPSMPINLLN